MQPHTAPAWTQLIPFVVIAVVLALRWRRMSRVQPLRLDRLWVMPTIIGVLIATAFAADPPVGTGWLWCALGLAAGAALGWQRGRTMRIAIDPATGILNQTGSPAALLFLVALVAVRSLARYEAGRHGFNPALVSGILLAMAFGLIAATRAEMYLRGRRLLATAQA